MVTFADWLTSKLKMEGLSPAELSARMGKDQSIISRYLAGTRQPSPDSIVEIARALRMAPEDVFRAVVCLPPKENNEHINTIAYRLSLLDEDDLQDIDDLVRAKLDRKAKKQ